ncbi:hypothetical protein CEF21_20955 [Bacillus sp. FJAT-42376]|uniref:hypothetical protein n=1 Tax=Bacillus sp. FJAT-42376 TaxID=2014076 RepID=UPI000F4F9D42|nr:hypothetical protein [Bacillus sp. FJAT-42376]AZB44554.1 hypothetical protein CEF21_20955 [Bacillus sp. FJAT-42376]
MKKQWLLTVWMILSIALMAACQDPEANAKEMTAAANTVKQVYKDAKGEDMEKFYEHFSKSGISKEDLQLSKIMFSDKVDQVGGIEKLTFTPIQKDELKADAAKMLKDEYKEDWTVVLEESKIGGTYFWILQKHGDRYYVINGDESPKEDILK